MSKKGIKKGLNIFTIIIVIVMAVIFTLIHLFHKENEEEKQKTEQLLITTEGVIETLPFDSTIKPILKKYLFLRQRNTNINGENYYYYYSTGENDLRGTESFVMSSDLGGHYPERETY